MQDFINALGTNTGNAPGGATFQNHINSNLQNLDQALQNVRNIAAR